MSVYSTVNHVNMNLVDGYTKVGTYSLDGKLNVVDKTDVNTFVGVSDTLSGATNVTYLSSISTKVGAYAPNGSLYIVATPGEFPGPNDFNTGGLSAFGFVRVPRVDGSDYFTGKEPNLVLDFTTGFGYTTEMTSVPVLDSYFPVDLHFDFTIGYGWINR